MQDRIGPWLPAIFCAALTLIVMVGNFWGLMKTGTGGAADSVFTAFMPMCFFFVGVYLSRLRKENHELRQRLDSIKSDKVDCDRTFTLSSKQVSPCEQEAACQFDFEPTMGSLIFPGT